MQLLGLPDELLIIILSDLSTRCIILSCRASCRRLRDVIDHALLIQQRIWCLENYTLKFSPPDLSISDFLRNAKNWRDDWGAFSFADEAATRDLHRPFQSHLDVEWTVPPDHFLLRSGYIIEQRKYQNPGWSYMKLSPQSELRGSVPAPQWEEFYFGEEFRMEGWSLDLDQDLVAALLRPPAKPKNRREIRLMQFKSKDPHKSAKIPVIQLKFKGIYDSYFNAQIEIMGTYLVVLLAHKSRCKHSSYQTLYLVDWVKGRVLCRQRSRGNIYFPVMTSISEDTFVLGLTNNCDDKRDWALALCRITKKGDATTISMLCILKLPAIQKETIIKLKGIDRAPSGTDDNPFGFTPKRHSRSTLPSRSSLSQSVLSFRVTAGRKKEEKGYVLTNWFFYVRSNTLRTLAERAVVAQASEMKNTTMSQRLFRRLAHCNFSSPSRPPITVPWEDWGPKATRWIDANYLSDCQSLSGMRCAISSWKSPGEVKVMDFNPQRLSMLKDKNEMLLVTSQSKIPAGKYFQHDIVSELPYIELNSTKAKGQLFIDDQWIVQIKSKKEGNKGYDIWVHSVDERSERVDDSKE